MNNEDFFQRVVETIFNPLQHEWLAWELQSLSTMPNKEIEAALSANVDETAQRRIGTQYLPNKIKEISQASLDAFGNEEHHDNNPLTHSETLTALANSIKVYAGKFIKS